MSKFNAKGWVPALPDIRDHQFAPKLSWWKPLPDKIDLRGRLPAVWNQGSIGSCVAHGVAICHIAAQRVQDASAEIMPSRLALYYEARALSGWVSVDSGCYISSALKTVANKGVADEKKYPYLVSKFKLKPPVSVAKDAMLHQAVAYERVDNTNVKAIQAALVEGLPVVFGSTLYENSYELDANYVMPMPDLSRKVVGGHAMAIVGYNKQKQLFLVRNSWGKEWGDNGHHWMPEAYITNKNLTDDCWIIKLVEV